MTPGRLLLLLARGVLPADWLERAHVPSVGEGWCRVFDRAEAHGVAPLVAGSLDALGWPGVPPPVRAAFEAARRVNAARSLLMARELVRLLERLHRAGVPVIPLKGVALSESLYGDPAIRVSVDLDVLVPREGVARAWAVLGELGYARADHEEPVEAADVGLLLESNIEYAFASPEAAGYPVELHWDIAWRWPHAARALADLWADARPRPFHGAPAHALGAEWEVLYLAVHAARHRWDCLKWLVDIDAICRRRRLDWRRVRAKAEQFGWTEVLEISLEASAALLDTPIPSTDRARGLPAWLELFPGTPDPLDMWQGALYPARLFARPSERLRYLARVLLVPTLAERRLIRLPRGFRALYYPLRPLRLGGRWGLDVLRGTGQTVVSRLTSSRDQADHRGSMQPLIHRGAGPARSKPESA